MQVGHDARNERSRSTECALQPGGRILEGTAGNTGIGLTLLANARGYKSTVVMPVTQSKEKIDTLELLGADLHLVGATSYSDPNHYIHTAQRLAEKFAKREKEGAVWARQFDNLANMDIHLRTTGTSIIEGVGINHFTDNLSISGINATFATNLVQTTVRLENGAGPLLELNKRISPI